MSPKEENYLFYDRFDMKTVGFDRLEFPFDQWALEQVQSLGFPVEDLSLLHEKMSPKETADTTKAIIGRTGDERFLRIADKYIEEILLPLVDNHPIGVQRFFNFRILLPNQPLSLIPFHNGQLQGHGLGERSTWMPLTDAFESSSLYLMDVENSRDVLKDMRQREVSYNEFQEALNNLAKPANISFGSTKVFTQENIHGSIPNTTGKTRVSFDFRILLQGKEFGHKIPGGYFRPFKNCS